MHNLWFISSDAGEREGMEMFLSQNDFAVTLYESIPAESAVATLPPPDIVILALSGANLPSGAELGKVCAASRAKRFYLLADAFNRMEISFILRHGVTGVFTRPLRPLAIIRKMKDDLEEDSAAPSTEEKPANGSGGLFALGNDPFSSEGWQILANQILSIADVPPILQAQCASPLIFRLYVEKVKRRLPASIVFFLDGDDATVKRAVLAEIQHGQWRRAPVMAIYAAAGLSESLANFFLHELGLLRAGEDGLVRLVLGSAVSPARLVQTGRMDANTAAFLESTAVELPAPGTFAPDVVKILQWRVRQLAAEADREFLFQPFPDSLFGDHSPTHQEVEALAQWISRRIASTGEIDEPTLRTVAENAALLPGLLESARTADARSAEYLRQREAALRQFTTSRSAES